MVQQLLLVLVVAALVTMVSCNPLKGTTIINTNMKNTNYHRKNDYAGLLLSVPFIFGISRGGASGDHSKSKQPKSKPKQSNANKANVKMSSTASASLRRIKKEYKDAVQMGIAYDWVKGRLIPMPSKKAKARTTSTLSTNNNNTTVPLEGNSENSNNTNNDDGTIAGGKIICLGPLTTNLRHWHFSFRGCGIYEAGIYHGRIVLPKDYPAKPPRIQLWTPSGRFVPYVNICLSASNYHPESWTPRWTILSLVQALRLHMLTNPQEIGGMLCSHEEIVDYAAKSLVWKITWQAGTNKKAKTETIVTVDHAKLLQQGAISSSPKTVFSSAAATTTKEIANDAKDQNVDEDEESLETVAVAKSSSNVGIDVDERGVDNQNNCGEAISLPSEIITQSEQDNYNDGENQPMDLPLDTTASFSPNKMDGVRILGEESSSSSIQTKNSANKSSKKNKHSKSRKQVQRMSSSNNNPKINIKTMAKTTTATFLQEPQTQVQVQKRTPKKSSLFKVVSNKILSTPAPIAFVSLVLLVWMILQSASSK